MLDFTSKKYQPSSRFGFRRKQGIKLSINFYVFYHQIAFKDYTVFVSNVYNHG